MNFHFGSQQPPTIHPSRDSSALFSLAESRRSGQAPVCPHASPEAADRGLPLRFGQTPHRPWWLWIDFSAATVSLSYRKGQPSYPPYHSAFPFSNSRANLIGEKQYEHYRSSSNIENE